MKKLIISGRKKLSGELSIPGSKNVILKTIVAACLTDEEVVIKNVPLLSDVYIMLDLLKEIGVEYELKGKSLTIRANRITSSTIPLEAGAKIRTSSMFLAPLLIRVGEAHIPNPGGCRIGARPIDRHIKALESMGASIKYSSEDGYFHAATKGLSGVNFKFEKNTHTGTETLILAAVLADGITTIQNAASEPEVDDLIIFLNSMGAIIKREDQRTIRIEGVKKLYGTTYTVMTDRNEVVTFAIASALTGGELRLNNVDLSVLSPFLEFFKKAGGAWEEDESGVRFYIVDAIYPSEIITKPHPGFMTDWQGPWALFMTQANGESSIHETVYENRFGYVEELKKMGAHIEFYAPHVKNPKEAYNFNYQDGENGYDHAIKIHGKTPLHNAIVQISDLRAGATLLLASLIASGESVIYGVEHLHRGYENIEERLKKIGASISEVEDKI